VASSTPQRLLQQQRGIGVLPGGQLAHERDVELGAGKGGELRSRAGVRGLHPHLRPLLAEAAEGGRQQPAGELERHPEPQDPAPGGGVHRERLAQPFDPREHRSGFVEQGAPGGGGTHAGAGAHEQLHAELALQHTDGLRQGRLRQVQTACGRRHAALLHDGDERPQLAQLHGASDHGHGSSTAPMADSVKASGRALPGAAPERLCPACRSDRERRPGGPP
jgi:hypothetical protein